MRPDVYILVGHSEASKGARSASGRTEWDFHRTLIDQLGPELHRRGVAFELAWRGRGQAGGDGLRQAIASANAIAPRLGIELHANASSSTSHAGVEVLHWPGSAAGLALAQALLPPVARVMSHPGRQAHRVIAQGASWNGPSKKDAEGRPVPGGPPLEWLRDTAFPAVILESHYLTHPPSKAWAEDRLRDGSLARAVVDGIVAALG